MHRIRGPLAALMSLSLACPPGAIPAPINDTARASARPAYHSGQLQGDQRILHALNRFTFGPRPGDLDQVRSIGLDRWFDQQLHPAQLDQSALQTRLAAYPAMQWSSDDLLRRLPSNPIIRQAIAGKLAVPESGVLHAVYENAMYRMAQKKEEKEKNAAQPSSPGDTGAKDDKAMMPASPAIENPAADPVLLADVLALSPQERIARLVAMQPAEADAFFKSLRGPRRTALTAGMPPALKETVAALENPERAVVEELIAQRLTRDIYSSAQLQEVMTDFWLNHFNVFLHKNETTPYYLVSSERDVIRPHALGKFEDLLESVAHSPAMLVYLDNAGSTGPDSLAAEHAKMNAWRNPDSKKNHQGLNENYARELMELHTLGVNGGYSQADVIQVARILTGWTVDRPQRGGEFRFDPNRHQPGTKKVMGQKFKEGGEREGRDLLHFLATRPATARFLSRKLAVRFVSDDPPPALIEQMARSYMSSGGDISAVLKTLFRSPEFWSTSAYRAKIKTPLEYVISTVRAGNADIANLRPLAEAMREMGMPLYGAVPPTGYKWEAAEWVSTGALVNRMNFALSLAANRLPGITTNWSTSSPALSSSDSDPQTGNARPRPSPQSEESRLESLLIGGPISATTRSAVLQQFETQSASTPVSPAPAQPLTIQMSGVAQNHAPATLEKQDQLLAGLLLGSPESQRR